MTRIHQDDETRIQLVAAAAVCLLVCVCALMAKLSLSLNSSKTCRFVTLGVVTMVLLSSTHVHTIASDDDAVAATTR